MDEDSVIDSIRRASVKSLQAQDTLRDAKYRARTARESLISLLIDHKVDHCLTVNQAALMRLLRGQLLK